MRHLRGFILFLCVGLILNNVGWAKAPPFNWYPAEFERLTVADWPEMKSTLDAVRQAKLDTDVSPDLLAKAWFTLSRMAKIKWEGAMQDQVRDYLLDFAEERKARDVAPMIVDKPAEIIVDESPVSTPADLGYVALWAAGKVSTDIPSPPRLVMLWRPVLPSTSPAQETLRWSVLDVLDEHFAEPVIPELLQTLGDMKPVTTYESTFIERIQRKHELSRFKDQKLAWEHIWTVTKPDQPEEVLTLKFWRKTGEWQDYLSKVYPLDAAIAMSISDESTDRFKKYVFLDKAVCILLDRLHVKAEYDGTRSIDQKLLSEVESKAQKMVEEMDGDTKARRVDGYQNYLKDSLQGMRRQAERPPFVNVKGSSVVRPNGASSSVAQTTPPGAPILGTEDHKPRMTRPEDRGEDFSKLDSPEVVRRLAAAALLSTVGEDGKTKLWDRVAVHRKGAKVLGDREIARTLELSEEDRTTLRQYIDKQIAATAAMEGGAWAEASQQLERLWTLAGPAMIDHLGQENPRVKDTIIQALILMRNEELVTQLIARIEANTDPRFGDAAIFTLGRMRERRESLVPGRVQLNDADSQALTDRLVIPFLDRWEKSHPDARTQEAISRARQSLQHPLDTRLRPAGVDPSATLAVLAPLAPEPTAAPNPSEVQASSPTLASSPAVSDSPDVAEQKPPPTLHNTALMIAIVLGALGALAGILLFRRR